nr:unnamed protein product [Callosobruchus chinensis]
MDFGDLSEDKEIQAKLQNFHENIQKIEEIINLAVTSDIYSNLSLKEKIDYDLFMAYALNTLYWLYLKTKNVDPNKNEIKNQLQRIKEYMIKAKQAHERQTIRPRLDKPAANRFVKHGLQHKQHRSNENSDKPLNKRIKFNVDDN